MGLAKMDPSSSGDVSLQKNGMDLTVERGDYDIESLEMVEFHRLLSESFRYTAKRDGILKEYLSKDDVVNTIVKSGDNVVGGYQHELKEALGFKYLELRAVAVASGWRGGLHDLLAGIPILSEDYTVSLVTTAIPLVAKKLKDFGYHNTKLCGNGKSLMNGFSGLVTSELIAGEPLVSLHEGFVLHSENPNSVYSLVPKRISSGNREVDDVFLNMDRADRLVFVAEKNEKFLETATEKFKVALESFLKE